MIPKEENGISRRWRGKSSYPGRPNPPARRDMNKNNQIIIQKIAAIILILLGLLAMLVAWQLLLVSNIHNSTVLVLEMGGVLICMAGYLLYRRIKALQGEAKSQDPVRLISE